MSEARWGRLGVASALLVALPFVVTVRSLVAGNAEFERAEVLRQSPHIEDLRDAVVHYRRAASWYVPGSPHVSRALDALARIAGAAEDANRRELALSAWRAVRSACATSRAPWPQHPARLAQADAAIARLTGTRPPPVVADDPSSWAVGLVLLGFCAFVGGVVAGLLRGFDASGRVVAHLARRYALLTSLGLVALIAGLALA